MPAKDERLDRLGSPPLQDTRSRQTDENNILTANIRLKRNSKYFTQVIPPDTIFVTVLLFFHCLRRRRAPRHRVDVPSVVRLVCIRKRSAATLVFFPSRGIGLFRLLRVPVSSSLLLLYISQRNRARDARASTARRQVMRTMYFCCCAVYTSGARALLDGIPTRIVIQEPRSPVTRSASIFFLSHGRNNGESSTHFLNGNFCYIFYYYFYIINKFIYYYYLFSRFLYYVVVSHDHMSRAPQHIKLHYFRATFIKF